jgi:hypothetical protein
VTCGTDLGVWGGGGSPEQGVPQWCKPSGGERRWWSRGAGEGTGKWVEGAPGVGAELAAVSGGSDGTGAVVRGGSMKASMEVQWCQQAEEEKWGCSTWGGVLLL